MSSVNLFIKGELYKAKQAFDVVRGASFSFKEGEVLKFMRDYYSHHDGETGFEFESQADGAIKYWVLSDKENADVWKAYFTLIS